MGLKTTERMEYCDVSRRSFRRYLTGRLRHSIQFVLFVDHKLLFFYVVYEVCSTMNRFDHLFLRPKLHFDPFLVNFYVEVTSLEGQNKSRTSTSRQSKSYEQTVAVSILF